MTGSSHKNAPLQWSVFVTKRPGLNQELPSGYESLAWVPNSSTLICGERDAVLVDTFLLPKPRGLWRTGSWRAARI
jgi:hypothetical protein